ncbi:MAG: hypothetical protein KGQ89_09955 [Verrucomicrobia bacterium]|nr:hypothetical protein [Verrucomicrobiota bacterium]
MTAEKLIESTRTDAEPPASLNPALRALWLSKAGRWDEAHEACQLIADPIGAWIHAHLHREEGDLGNAAYWYHRAGKSVPPRSMGIAEEWSQLVQQLG